MNLHNMALRGRESRAATLRTDGRDGPGAVETYNSPAIAFAARANAVSLKKIQKTIGPPCLIFGLAPRA